MQAVCDADLRVVTKPSNNHKFEFEGQSVAPIELIEKVKEGEFQFLEKDRFYQRLTAYHHCYGEVVLIVRSRQLKNGKIIYDVLLCNCSFYIASRIDKCYSKRWNIEMQFKYYKQYLNLGKTHKDKLGAIQSALYCVAIAGLLGAKYCRNLVRFIRHQRAVKQMMSYFTPKKYYIIQ